MSRGVCRGGCVRGCSEDVEKRGASALNAATLKAASPRLDALPHIETCHSSSI